MNVFNPENIQIGDKVRLLRDVDDFFTKEIFTVINVGGPNKNKVACKEFSGEFYASCFTKKIQFISTENHYKVIHFYKRTDYGTEREYISKEHNEAEWKIITTLTGKSSITPAFRELFRDLTGGAIQWIEIPNPH